MTTIQSRSAEARLALPPAPDGLTGRRPTAASILKFFGPGAVIASLTIGSGESILASREGAVFGYGVLWALIAAVVAKGAIVYSSNRYIVLTGEHPMTRFARVFPGPRGWFAALLAVICFLSFPGWASGVARALGDYLSLMGVGSPLPWAFFCLILAAVVSYVGGYSVLEKTQVAMALGMVLLVLVAVFVAQPDWAGVLRGLVPGGLEYQGFVGEKFPDVAETSVYVEMAVFLGGIGGGMYDYIGYTGMMREKRWGMLGHKDVAELADRYAAADAKATLPLDDSDANLSRARGWARAPLIDLTAAFVALAIIGAAFVINGATILAADEVVPEGNDVLSYQARFFGVIAPVFEYFYAVAIVMVLFGTIYAIWEAYSWTAYESISALSTKVRRAGQRKMRPFVYAWTFIGASAMLLTGADFVQLITPASIVGGIIACGIYGLGMLYIDRVNVPAPFRMSKLLAVLVGVGSVFLGVAGTVALASFLGIAG
ncbi:MAG TPA: Nramp family divalent metal transporter [Nocardioidaceae bacterium]|nr:Nramp family divalent metal transporter [Nocardioidaceae bacterium]